MTELHALLGTLANQAFGELMRLAWTVSRLGPALAVVGGAAVVAGLLGAASMRHARRTRYQAVPRAGHAPSSGPVPWALGLTLLASGLVASPSPAEVLCRKGTSPRLVLRESCRAREHVVGPSEVGLGIRETCLDGLALAWDDLARLRTYLEAARDLAAELEVRPWDDRGIRLAMYAAAIVEASEVTEDRFETLGITAARVPAAAIRQLVTTGWTHPLDACTQALALLPVLEAALPLLPPT
jgi:hypothetical protein